MGYDYRYGLILRTLTEFFFRSDHVPANAVNGIPVAFWFDGGPRNYHQPATHRRQDRLHEDGKNNADHLSHYA